MRPRDLIFLVTSNLRRMKVRLALTALGVVIGTSAIVLMISLGIGLQNNVLASLSDVGSATHITVMGGMGMPGVEEIKQLDEQALEQFSELDGVVAVVPLVWVQGMDVVRYKRAEGYLNAQGVPMSEMEALGYELQEGRFPRNDKEILLGAAAASFNSTGRNSQPIKSLDLLGKKLEVSLYEVMDETVQVSEEPMEPKTSTRKLTVVGVLKKADMQTDQMAFLPLDLALDINGVSKRKLNYEQVTVKVDSPAATEDVEKQITELGYQTFSAASIAKSLKTTFLVIQGVLGALGAIAMLVASLGIANTMTMSIFERTREIGIMKALGASSRQIKRVFLGEAAIIGVIGGVGGLAFSMSGAALANLFVRGFIASQASVSTGEPPQIEAFFAITPGLAFFAIAFAAGVGLLAGVLPAVRAANLDPLTALRHE